MTGVSATEAAETELRDRAVRWRAWLFDDALPLWAERGRNPAGGFFDRLTGEGAPTDDPMRMRVQGRQTWVFAAAGRMGWTGDWRSQVEHGLEFLLHRAARPDGLMAHAFTVGGEVTDAGPDLYDQSFALLALAGAYGATGDARAKTAALALLDGLEPHRHPAGGFRELAPGAALLKSNPHMHLLEAALEWTDVDDHPRWRLLVDDLVALCVDRLADPITGALREFFVGDWRPAPEGLGDCTEPGHHFEWAWLLNRAGPGREALVQAMCDRAETFGVDRGRNVAVNAMGLDGEVLDPAARLWPQTERLKAALTMRAADPAWTERACEAADSLALYTEPCAPGLWLDLVDAEGALKMEASPASSLYHLVCAISELAEAARLSK